MQGSKSEFDIIKKSINMMIISIIIALISVCFSFVVTFHYAKDEGFIDHQKRLIQDQFNLEKTTINYKVKSNVETPAFIARTIVRDKSFDNKYHITIFYDRQEYEKEILRVNELKKGATFRPGQVIKLPVYKEESNSK